MKKLFFLSLTAGVFMAISANGQQATWVKTADGQINCRKISAKQNELKVVLENGEKKVLPAGTVELYFRDNKLYLKMPLYSKGVKGSPVFMEFVKTRDDLSLYKYLDTNNYRYFVYKGNDFYIELLDDNLAYFKKFFNI